MPNYQRVQLPSTNIGDPAPLPDFLVGLDDATLADLSTGIDSDAAAALGVVGQGFFPVADPAPPAPPPIISPYEFLNLFTSAERVAILTVAQSNMSIADWLNMLNHVSAVHLDDPKTIAGVHALETATLIGAGRADEILAGEAPS